MSHSIADATNAELYAELDYRNVLHAHQRRYERYAVKFTVDAPQDEPTDANLGRVLARCGRQPKPEEYPHIRRYVELWREAQTSGRASVREQIMDRAESYARDAVRFADMGGESERYAGTYRTIADELRKVADSL